MKDYVHRGSLWNTGGLVPATLHRNTPPADESCRTCKRRKRVSKLKSHDSASMMVEDRALQGLGEHVGMIFLGILVFHNDFPFGHPFEYFFFFAKVVY